VWCVLVVVVLFVCGAGCTVIGGVFAGCELAMLV